MLLEEGVIDAVHCSKVGHVVQEDSNFDNVLERRTSFVKDLTKIS